MYKSSRKRKSIFSQRGRDIINSKRIERRVKQRDQLSIKQNELYRKHLNITENIAHQLIINNKSSHFFSDNIIELYNGKRKITDITDQEMEDIERLIPEGQQKQRFKKISKINPTLKKLLIWTLILLIIRFIRQVYNSEQFIDYQNEHQVSSLDVSKAPSRPIPSDQIGFVCSIDPSQYHKQCFLEQQFHVMVGNPDIHAGELILEENGTCFPYKEYCDLTDSNNSCKGNIGIERNNMPQVSVKDLIKLQEQGITYKSYNLTQSQFIEKNFLPSQATASTQAIDFFYSKFLKEPNNNPIFVSSDGYIIDGHHRFYVYRKAIESGIWSSDKTLHVIEIDLPIERALQVFRGLGGNVEDKYKNVYKVKD